MRRTDPLSDRQLAVLRWIGDGCPDGVMTGSSYKVSGRALADRQLVTIDRRGGTWTTELTDTGRYYLEHGHHPPATPAATRSRTSEPAQREPPRPASPSRPAVATSDLLTRLQAEDGRLVIEDPSPEIRAAWRRALDAVRRLGLVPDGQHLRHTGRDHGDLVIELRDGEHPELPRFRGQPEPLVVADEVADWHPAATGQFAQITKEHLPRARRLVHTLAQAATKQGIAVSAGADTHALTFQADDQAVGLAFFEIKQVRHVLPDVDESADGPRYSWQRVRPEPRQTPTGQFVMQLDRDWQLSGRRSKFSDTERGSLEHKLTGLLQEITYRLNDLRERKEAARQAQHDRQQAWEAAKVQAHRDFQESRRVAELDGQLADWERADRIRAYCEALAAVHDDRDAERASWIVWARGYAEQLDPRGHRDVAPPEIEPKPQQLTEFMRGWSPYTPERRR